MKTDLPGPELANETPLERAMRQQLVLEELGRVGLLLGEALLARARAGTVGADEAVLSYECIVRQVGRTLVLRRQIQKEAARIAAEQSRAQSKAGRAAAASVGKAGPAVSPGTVKSEFEQGSSSDTMALPPRRVLH
jgi:hypothetical protein